MDPFENTNNDNNDLNNLIKIINIEIWTENRGRKIDTYINGLIYNDDKLKELLKILKKDFACNGSIKNNLPNFQGKKILHIQGNHKQNIINYLLNNGINRDQLIVKN